MADARRYARVLDCHRRRLPKRLLKLFVRQAFSFPARYTPQNGLAKKYARCRGIARIRGREC